MLGPLIPGHREACLIVALGKRRAVLQREPLALQLAGNEPGVGVLERVAGGDVHGARRATRLHEQGAAEHVTVAEGAHERAVELAVVVEIEIGLLRVAQLAGNLDIGVSPLWLLIEAVAVPMVDELLAQRLTDGVGSFEDLDRTRSGGERLEVRWRSSGCTSISITAASTRMGCQLNAGLAVAAVTSPSPLSIQIAARKVIRLRSNTILPPLPLLLYLGLKEILDITSAAQPPGAALSSSVRIL